MRGIECAFTASLGQDVELRKSKAGKTFATFPCVVDMGHEDGKETAQWLRCICFGDTAEKLAERAKKADRVYVEGSLSLNSWEGADGETKHGLNVTAWRAERLSNIGRAKPKRPALVEDEDEAEPAQADTGERGNLLRAAKALKVFKAKEKKAKPQTSSKDWPFNDELSF